MSMDTTFTCPVSVVVSLCFMTRRETISARAVSFGAIIRRLREQRQWTIVEFARETGMNVSYLGYIERGENSPTLETIIHLAQVLGAAASDVLLEMEKQ